MRNALLTPLFAFFALQQVASQRNNGKKVKGRFTRSVDNFEVVVPRKVTIDGEFVSHYLPHFYTLENRWHSSLSRRRRSVDDDSVHYVVAIEGVDRHLELTPHTTFISPGLVIEEQEADIRVNKDAVKLRKIRSTQCHYHGVVRGQPNSKVAISTCYGIAGHIRTGGKEYLIEPVDSEDSEMNGVEHKHIIFKREEFGKGTNCGTKGNKSNGERNVQQTKSKRTSTQSNKTSLSVKRSCAQLPCCQPPPIPGTCPPDKPIFLELLVTVDNQIRAGSPKFDIDQYILTIINMVAMNFRDDSLGVPISIKLVRVLYLAYDCPELDVFTNSHQDLLKNFCVWQKAYNPFKDVHPIHHDYAVLVTRFNPCQILGVTNQRGMCNPDRSCAVVSNEGLLLANIITHQIGHSLGAEHDEGADGGCSAQEPDGTRYHMASYITQSSSEWSVCSRDSILNFVQSASGICLTDIPTDYNHNFPPVLPGQIYSATEQCTFSFHMQSLACRTGNICELLYCQVSSKLCISSGDPPAAGTPCARNMWCFHGACVHRGIRPGAIHGAWSEWSKWTPCSRSCGGGVQSAYRTCTNPAPRYGGRPCFGSWLKHRMCSMKICDGYTVPFATVQCKMTNRRPYQGILYTWSAFVSHFKALACNLVCVNEMNMVVMRSPIVIDGTPCKSGELDVCVQGSCRHVGCDYVIDSNAKEDLCGRCHGKGTECKIVQGEFDEPNLKGMIHILCLPVGTTMIFIRESRPSECLIVVTSSVNSTKYLNEDPNVPDLPGNVWVAGSQGTYGVKGGMERLLIKGPTKVPLAIKYFCEACSTSGGLHYQYALPEGDPSYIPTYSWKFMYWDECSEPCGGGTQRAVPVCIEALSGEVEDKYCNLNLRPRDALRTCNPFPCRARWWIGPWSECDGRNGEGIMVRSILCMRPRNQYGTFGFVVNEKECCSQPKPPTERACDYNKKMELLDKIIMRREKRNPLSNESYPEVYYDGDVELYNENNFNGVEDISMKKRDVDSTQTYQNSESDHEPMTGIHSVQTPSVIQKTERDNSGKLFDSTFNLKKMKPKFNYVLRNSSNMIQKKEPSPHLFPFEENTRNEDLHFVPSTTEQNFVTNYMKVTFKTDLKSEIQEKTTNSLLGYTNILQETLCHKTDTCTECCLCQTDCPPARKNKCSNEMVCTLTNEILDARISTGLPRIHSLLSVECPLRVDSGNSTSSKIILVPISHPKIEMEQTDIEFQMFGLNALPIANESKPLVLSSEVLFGTLENVRRHTTTLPIVQYDEDD